MSRSMSSSASSPTSSTQGHNPYNFDEFLAWRNEADFLQADPFMVRAIQRYAQPLSDEAYADVASFAQRLTERYQHLADTAGRPENAPVMMHFDAHNNRIDRIVRPAETLQLEREIWNEAMFSKQTDRWQRFLKIFLMAQIGEAGVGCAHCCTSGLILILERFAETPELQAILEHCTEGKDGEYAIGAQFLSEIQGGSDVQANRVEALGTEDGWRIYGTKFYCSAAHADYALVTAKPSGSQDVGLFVVPMWADKARERRNGYVINKLKSKLGTRELPTAEITFEGAVAYPAGDLQRGLANIVGIVLAHSRFITGMGAAAYMIRATREAKQYAKFRTAFGVTIEKFGLVARQLGELDTASKRSTASILKMQREIFDVEDLAGSPEKTESDNAGAFKRQEFRLRMLIMLHKLVVSADAARLTETAMSIFGGHGLMEDFSSIPRLYRDAVVLNGAWEGPRNLLLTRIFMDMQRAAVKWYEPAELIADLLPATDTVAREDLANQLGEILAFKSLVADDPQTLEVCDRWDALCIKIFHAYQDEAVAEVEAS